MSDDISLGAAGAAITFNSEKNVVSANEQAARSLPFIYTQGISGFLTSLGYELFERQLISQRSLAVRLPKGLGTDCVWVFTAEESGLVSMKCVMTAVPDTHAAQMGADLSDMMGNVTRESLQKILSSLSGVLCFTDDKKVYDAARDGRRCCYAALRNSNNFGMLRRFYSGESLPDFQDCDLGALLSSLCSAVSAVCKGAPPLYFEQKQSVVCRVDAFAVELAVINLISNSMRFTRDGNSISVSLSAGETDAVITVSDRGTGIPAEILQNVRLPFFSRDPGDLSAPPPYAGNGLAVAECAARLHSGEMVISSVYGAGTRVALHFPAVPAKGELLKSREASDLLIDSFSPVYVGLCDFCEPAL